MKRLAALIAFVAFCIAGCARLQPELAGARHSYTHPHELRFAIAEDIRHLNAFFGTDEYENFPAELCLAYLARTDSTGEATVPELAIAIPSLRNGGVSRNGRTITYHLRHGVKWSDGAPFDADDVVFTTKQVLDPANSVRDLNGWNLIDRIGEPDKFTVVYHLKKPYPFFAIVYFSSNGYPVLPKHLLAGVRDLATASYNSLPIGIGPFKFQSWKRSDSVVMVRNPNYFRGVPKLERIVLKLLPDRNTTLAQLRSHEIDLWFPISPHFYAQARTIDGVSGTSHPSYAFDQLGFNFSHPILEDVRVRRALRLALDRAKLVAVAEDGRYRLDESPITEASRYHVNLPLVPFDLAAANALLEAAGWKRAADGIRIKDGRRLSLVFVCGSGLADYDIENELIRAWWKQIGVELTVKRFPASLLYATRGDGGILAAGKFDIARFALVPDTSEDFSDVFACGNNAAQWCDPSTNAAMERAKTENDDRARARDLASVQRAVYDHVPIIVLDARRELAIYNSDLKNWRPHPSIPFDDMMNVDI